MKWVRWGVSILMIQALFSVPVDAIDTAESLPLPTKTTSPIVITGYSFAAGKVRYVQIYNSSNNVVDLDEWSVSIEVATVRYEIAVLSGKILPGKYASIADLSVVPTATHSILPSSWSDETQLSSISLTPRSDSNYLPEVTTPTVTSSTPRVAGNPPTFYFARNVSASTGNYLSSYTAFIPSNNFVVTSDPIYIPPVTSGISIVEVFADSAACAPFERMPTCVDYVKIYNETVSSVDLSQYRIRTGSYGQTSTGSNTVRMHGALGAGQYAVVETSLSASGSWVWLEDAFGLVAYEQTVVGYPSNAGHDLKAWSYDSQVGTWRWTAYITPQNVPNDFGPVMPVNNCHGLQVSEIAANVDEADQFVEIHNTLDEAVDATGCMIQTNRSAVRHYLMQGVVEPGAQTVIYIKDTDLLVTKTTKGIVYLLSSDGQSEVHSVGYDSLAANTSWIKTQSGWAQTFLITPGGNNQVQELESCSSGYVRNPESGLCNKLRLTTQELADCGEGKYRSLETNRCRMTEESSNLASCPVNQTRNPDTNRCRSLVSTAALLAPCAVGQERNPETNRCKSTQASTEVKPCEPSQERNPDTNRCRAKSNAIAADFPVDTVAQSGEALLGWWAFGGVGLVAAGYASWEWRREAASAIKKVAAYRIGRR